MVNFKEIAEKCLAGELSGTFVTAFDNKWHSSYLQRYAILGHEMPEQYVLGPGVIYNKLGQCESRKEVKIIDFIPDMKQQQIKIDIPEGMEIREIARKEHDVTITLQEKQLTYAEILNEFRNNVNCIHTNFINSASRDFYKKVEVLRKLTNIRNYFGKPDKKNSDSGWVICINGTVYRAIVEQNSHVPVFAEKEHAEQAIKMLGDELKYLFEPW